MSRRFGAIPTDEVCYGHASILINPSATKIWTPDPGGDGWGLGGVFVGKINGNPTSTDVPYDTDTGEDSMSVNMVLHNTTKGKKVRITAITPGTNHITVEANSPDDADVWDDNDNLTTASQTNTGRAGLFFDLDVTAFITYTNAQAMFFQATLADSGVSSPATIIWHPYCAYAQAKETANLKLSKPAASTYMAGNGIVSLTWEGAFCYITMGIFWVVTLQNGLMTYIGEF